MWGPALANVKPPGSQMAGGARGQLPRAASADWSSRARKAPPDSVHASRSCRALVRRRGVGAQGSGCPQPKVKLVA